MAAQTSLWLIQLLHDGMTGQVLCSSDQSAALTITNGMKQGCVLAPVLFNLFFMCMLAHAVQDMGEGCRCCGSILSLVLLLVFILFSFVLGYGNV